MLNKYLTRVMQMWRHLNVRERRLAQVVALLVLLFMGYNLVQNSLVRLNELDARIDNYQQDLVNYRQQIALRQRVEQRYSRIAAQHSSAWSESEIQDRLRQEIYRLAMRTPPGLTPDGYPERSSDDRDTLVLVPTLGQGTLQEGGQGYREFMIAFRVPRAEFANMVTFLERLQTSPQSLRIDDLEINRSPLTTEVQSMIQITRTIVDGTDTLSADVPETLPLARWEDGLNPEDWQCDGCELTGGSDGEQVLLASTNGSDSGALYTTYPLEGGRSYRILLDALSAGNVSLAAAWGETGRPAGNPVQLQNDGMRYTYELTFTAPYEAEAAGEVRIPVMHLAGADTEVAIHRLQIEETRE